MVQAAVGGGEKERLLPMHVCSLSSERCVRAQWSDTDVGVHAQWWMGGGTPAAGAAPRPRAPPRRAARPARPGRAALEPLYKNSHRATGPVHEGLL